jgi:hypothetical protein
MLTLTQQTKIDKNSPIALKQYTENVLFVTTKNNIRFGWYDKKNNVFCSCKPIPEAPIACFNPLEVQFYAIVKQNITKDCRSEMPLYMCEAAYSLTKRKQCKNYQDNHGDCEHLGSWNGVDGICGREDEEDTQNCGGCTGHFDGVCGKNNEEDPQNS